MKKQKREPRRKKPAAIREQHFGHNYTMAFLFNAMERDRSERSGLPPVLINPSRQNQEMFSDPDRFRQKLAQANRDNMLAHAFNGFESAVQATAPTQVQLPSEVRRQIDEAILEILNDPTCPRGKGRTAHICEKLDMKHVSPRGGGTDEAWLKATSWKAMLAGNGETDPDQKKRIERLVRIRITSVIERHPPQGRSPV